MARAVNFADSDFEPSDEELVQLSVEAFAGLREARERAVRVMRAEIAEERKRVLARLNDSPISHK
jgi:hypothetical protein